MNLVFSAMKSLGFGASENRKCFMGTAPRAGLNSNNILYIKNNNLVTHCTLNAWKQRIYLNFLLAAKGWVC